mgnify:CR=1 FL=1
MRVRAAGRHPGSFGVRRPDRSVGGLSAAAAEPADEKGGGFWDLIADVLWGTSSGPQTGKEALNEAGLMGLTVLSGGLPQLPALTGRTLPFLRGSYGVPRGVSAGLAPRAAASAGPGLPGRLAHMGAQSAHTERLAALAAMLATERGREAFRHPTQTPVARGAASGWDWLTAGKDPSAPWYEIW